MAVILDSDKRVCHCRSSRRLFEQMDTLPLSTRILNSISDFMQSYWYIAIILIVGTVGRSKGASDDLLLSGWRVA
ncbi:MAG: hypothetical protein ACLTLQ_06430 [[Clostridium] scindens]